MSRTSIDSSERKALVVLTSAVVGFLAIFAAYWAQVVLIPVVFAVLLTLVLSPFVTFLESHGLGRVPSVILVVLATTGLMAGFGWLLTNQVTGLLQQLPDYTHNIETKLRSLREYGAGTGRLENMVQEISREVQGDSQPARPTAVLMQPEGPQWIARAFGYFGSALAMLASCILALVLTVFTLLRRENLRNRFLRLFGRNHLTLTTKAVDDALHRIGRFLLMQLTVNTAYGVLFALGLLVIGVPHAVLWGLIMAAMRYVPYVGCWVVLALVLILSLAMSAGAAQPLAITGLFLTLELLTGNLVEPMLFGKSIGVSEFALLIAAAFWAFLWGPIGLVLSCPLTVCLVVLGKHVPQLKFLDVLLGDEPALDPDVSFYQRLLARDTNEATTIALTSAKSAHPDEVYDELLVPTLDRAKRDPPAAAITAEDQRFIHRAIRDVMARLREARAEGEKPETPAQPCQKKRVVIYSNPHQADALALEMFRDLLESEQWEVQAVSPDTPAVGLAGPSNDRGPAVVCIGSVAPGGLSRIRSLCKQLRDKLPGTKIVIGRWGGRRKCNRELDEKINAGSVSSNLLDTRECLNSCALHSAGGGMP